MKTILYGAVIISVTFGLGGCARWNAVQTALMGPTQDQVIEQQQAVVRQHCDEAPILYANLTTPAANRMYSLPDKNQTLCI